jgi:Uma2 family endonuclease
MTVTLQGARIDAMQAEDVVFESTRTFDQDEFEAWVHERSRAGDIMHYELLNGRVVMTPPAGYPHGEVGSKIQGIVGPFVRSRRLGKVFDSSQGFALPSGDTLEPDTAFVSPERWAAAPPPEFGAFLHVVPDVVFEVLSKNTASRDRGEKKAIYAANGVREYWIVDARAQEVLVFSLDGARYGRERVFDMRQRATSLVLDGLEIPVADIMP